MSTCKYCGKDAGFMRSAHKECLESFNAGSSEVADLLLASARGKLAIDVAVQEIRSIAIRSFIDSESLRKAVVKGFESAVDLALNDDLLTQDEEDALATYQSRFDSSNELQRSSPSYTRLVKAGFLREMMEGKLPERVVIDGYLPINFQKSERPVWVFQDVEYLQPRTRTTYEGRSSGVSFRVMKGVYYRVGQFKGNPVQTTQIVAIDTGLLAVTDKHLYFVGQSKSVKIKFDKIISLHPYSDAVAIHRDGVAKQDIFKTDDGWFTYNLLSNLVFKRD